MKDEESSGTQEVHDIAINHTFLDDCASHVDVNNEVGNSRQVPPVRG